MKTEKGENKIIHLVVFAVFIATALVITGSQTLFGQVTRTKPAAGVIQTKRVFKGNGVSKPTVNADALNRANLPADLTNSQLSKALGDVMILNGFPRKEKDPLPIENYATISVQNPYIKDKVLVELTRARYVSPTVPKVEFIDGDGILDFYSKPDQAGKWFMISCKVYAASSTKYTIQGPDGSIDEMKADILPNNQGKYLINTFMISQNTEWQHFQIKAEFWWTFYSCSVTTPGK